MVKVRFNGPQENPLTDGDELSLVLLRAHSSSIRYMPVSDGEYSNMIIIEQSDKTEK